MKESQYSMLMAHVVMILIALIKPQGYLQHGWAIVMLYWIFRSYYFSNKKQ